MAALGEVKNQIVNIHKIQKITRAMRNVAASKMQRAQQRMMASIAYAAKIREVMEHIAGSDSIEEHVYMRESKQFKKVGYIVISSDHGLCGGLNHNLFKKALEHANNFKHDQIQSAWCVFGTKGALFFHDLQVDVMAQMTCLGDTPKVTDLLGGVKVMLDAYKSGEIGRLFIVHNYFVNTLVQKPLIEQLLPLVKREYMKQYRAIYIYEPSSNRLLETLMTRYIEMQVYQAVVDNIACEQAARMISMKNATDSSQDIINDLRLVYNKARQSNITRELAEIISGAEAQLA